MQVLIEFCARKNIRNCEKHNDHEKHRQKIAGSKRTVIQHMCVFSSIVHGL